MFWVLPNEGMTTPSNLDGHKSVMEVFVFILSDPHFPSLALAVASRLWITCMSGEEKSDQKESRLTASPLDFTLARGYATRALCSNASLLTGYTSRHEWLDYKGSVANFHGIISLCVLQVWQWVWLQSPSGRLDQICCFQGIKTLKNLQLYHLFLPC